MNKTKLKKNNAYRFFYYFKRKEWEREAIILAEDDEMAVKKFYDKIGMAHFGCLKENGQTFTDDKYSNIKKDMEKGC